MLAWLKRRIQFLAGLLVFRLNRFLDWLFSSRLPAVVYVREFILDNDVLLFVARALVRTVSELPKRLREELFAGQSARRLQSILAARDVGGSVTVSEFAQILGRTRRGTRVVAIAAMPELRQIEIILKGARAKVISHSAAGINNIGADDFDLIIAAPSSGTEQQIEALRNKLQKPEAFLRVGETSKRSDNCDLDLLRARTVQGTYSERRSVEERLAQGIPLRIVFLNDVGFRYGAGIALKRQVASFLLKDFEVHLVAWAPGEGDIPPTVVGVSSFRGWQGVHKVGRGRRGKVKSDDQLVSSVLSTIRALEPNVIITGNLHGTRFPLDLAQGLKTIDALVVSYMHDCFWATGRCAYPVSCQLYQTGCNETCPTADEYPKLAREEIGAAWRTKADVFQGESGIPLVTNSGWTRDFAVRRFGGRARIDCVPLAVDHELFAPIPKAVARRLLGLPAEGTFIVMGAVDILNKWKGGDLFRAIHEKLQNRNDVSVLLFGQSSALLKSTRSFGLVEDERLMPFILNSADILVGTATEEAFGQTLLEAAACGTPVVAFNRGGVGDIVVNEETGLLVENLSVIELYTAINRLLADPALRERLGSNARKRVEAHFTLTKQADAWISYLKTLSSSQHR
jgi:glycosyltransferase involved in cell wall biosynthesis